jgi:predicted  nucleic acid-binding Zn-ribbon protein
MKILTLTLENFQGVPSATFCFSGKTAHVYGENATGKTTIFNAFSWLLFGQPGTDIKRYTPKTYSESGEVHNTEHKALVALKLDDGRMITFGKTFKEVWKKKRGSAEAEFSGHTTEYFVDGVPVSEAQYNAQIISVIGTVERARMLTNPAYFSEKLDWKERRKMLLTLCAERSDLDIMRSAPALAELLTLLLKPGTADQYYTADELKAIAAAQRKKINDELTLIPARIDECKLAIRDCVIARGSYSAGTLEAELRRLHGERDALVAQKAEMYSGDTALQEINTQIAQKKADIATARAAFMDGQYKAGEDTRSVMQAKRAEVDMVRQQLAQYSDELLSLTLNAKRLEAQREALLAEFENVNATRFDSNATTCVTCGQALPIEHVESAKSAFNLKRSEQLSDIRLRGATCSTDVIRIEQQKIDNAQMRIDDLTKRCSDLETEVSSLAETLVTEEWEKSDEYKWRTEELGTLFSTQADATLAVGDAARAIQEQLDKVTAQLSDLEERKAKIDASKAQSERIAELEARQKELTKTFEQTEKTLYLIEQFVRAKVAALTDEINAHFQTLRFKLFNEQINGGLTECCEVMIPSPSGAMTPYRDANHAAQILSGLEVIAVFSKHYGMTFPVFVDNAEAVVEFPTPQFQTVYLAVCVSSHVFAAMENATTVQGSDPQKPLVVLLENDR